jgi:hypothetical protein
MFVVAAEPGGDDPPGSNELDDVAVPLEARGATLGRASGATSSPRRKTAHAPAPPPTTTRTTTMMAVRAGRDLIGRSFGPAVRDF